MPARGAGALALGEEAVLQKLLVPLDGTPQAGAALPPARAIAQATGAAVVLVRVIPDDLPGAADQARAAADQYLAGVAAELAKSNLQVHTLVLAGARPADEILRAVAAERADLIVMATHARGGLQRVLLGSVTQDVLAASPVPLLLVRPGRHRVARVTALLIPVDGSPGGTLALGLAMPLAQATGARLVLLQVVPPLPADVKAQLVLAAPIAEALPGDAERLASAEHYVTQLVARLQNAGLVAEGHAVLGPVAATIVRTARDTGADIIVMSTHALTGPARAVLGSVADEVLRSADRPVLLVPRRQRPAE